MLATPGSPPTELPDPGRHVHSVVVVVPQAQSCRPIQLGGESSYCSSRSRRMLSMSQNARRQSKLTRTAKVTAVGAGRGRNAATPMAAQIHASVMAKSVYLRFLVALRLLRSSISSSVNDFQKIGSPVGVTASNGRASGGRPLVCAATCCAVDAASLAAPLKSSDHRMHQFYVTEPFGCSALISSGTHIVRAATVLSRQSRRTSVTPDASTTITGGHAHRGDRQLQSGNPRGHRTVRRSERSPR